MVKTIGAGLLGWVMGSVIAAAVWFMRPGRPDVLALSIGLREALLGALAVGTTAGVLHLALGWAGSAVHPVLAAHRALAIGLLGVLWGVLSFLTTGTLVQPVR